MTKKFLVSLCLAAGFCAQSAFGAAVTIGNSSFEGPDLTGGGATWTNTLEEWTTDGAAGDSFVEFISGFVADGQQHIGLQNGQSVYQNLATNFTPNTMYTLTVATGNRAGHSAAGDATTYQIEDSTGSVLATGAYDAFTNVAAGAFADAPSISYISPASGGPTGAIRINLINGGAGRSHFDNIRLDASVIPEPVTLSFLSMGALLLLRRRRR